jgi:Fe2+ or Zn2+ uptake regulation protein
MANKYYTNHSVSSPQEASIFSDVYTWSIFDILCKAGAVGLTAQAIHKEIERKMRTSVSKSKVYALLKRLNQEEWVHRYYDKDSQAQRNAINKTLGGFVEFDKDYEHTILDKEGDYIKKQLFPIFLTFIKKALKDLDASSKEWVPFRGPKAYCKTCGISHEAEEFFSSLLDEAVAEFFDSKEYMEFLRQNNFAEEEDK